MFHLTARLLDALGIALYVLDADDRTVLWNANFLRFFPEHEGQIHAGEHYGDNLRRFYRHRLVGEDLTHLERFVRDGITRHQTQTRPFVFQHHGRWLRVAALPSPDGGRMRVWMDLSSTADPLPGPAAHPPLPEGELQVPQAIQILENLGEGALVLDADQRILFCNDSFAVMYGIAHKHSLPGRSYAELLHHRWSGASEDERQLRAQDLAAALRDGMHFEGAPFEVPLPDGHWIRVTHKRTAQGQSYTFHTDISASKRQQLELQQTVQRVLESEKLLRTLADELRSEALHDPLTGLENRRSLEAQLRDLEDVPGHHALLFIDLDGFKAVNDQAGHAVGDQVLRQAADRLRQAVRVGDPSVRLGGDEFVVLLCHCTQAQALAVGSKIVEAIGLRPFDVAGQGFRVGASIGVRTFGGEIETAATLVHDADAACYMAKRLGRGRVELHRSVVPVQQRPGTQSPTPPESGAVVQG